jgi:hypothetical protein
VFLFAGTYCFLFRSQIKKLVDRASAFLVGVGCLLVLLFGSKAGYGFFGDINFMFIYTFFGALF